MPSTSPKLWVVATPLGNPGDLSPRAREVLAAVDVVLAEDTRRTGLLFQKCGVTARRFISFHDHNEDGRIPELLTMLQSGTTAALVSDAGMPLFADPGYRLVRACRDAGVHISVVPGPSAPLTALAASGIAPLPFTFLGFPPRKASEQEKFFAPFTTVATTLVFFERKDRLAETLAVAHGVLGHRELCVARELTKTHEEFIYGRLECHTAIPDDLLGEITVVIGPPEEASVSPREQVLAIIEEERADGGRTKDVAKRVQLRVRGWSVKDVYQLMQE